MPQQLLQLIQDFCSIQEQGFGVRLHENPGTHHEWITLGMGYIRKSLAIDLSAVPRSSDETSFVRAIELNTLVNGQATEVTYDAEVEVSFRLEQADLDQVDGDTRRLVVLRFNPTADQWETIETTYEPDPPPAGRLVVKLKSFSLYAVGAREEITPLAPTQVSTPEPTQMPTPPPTPTAVPVLTPTPGTTPIPPAIATAVPPLVPATPPPPGIGRGAIARMVLGFSALVSAIGVGLLLYATRRGRQS